MSVKFRYVKLLSHTQITKSKWMSNIDNVPFVLIVDDNPKNLQVLGEILSEINCSIGVATNGKRALASAKEVHPDLILMDVVMPEMDGFTTTQKLKEDSDTKDIPVIFLTAKTETSDIIKGFEIGGIDYVTKPFNAPELIARVKTQLKITNDQKVIQSQKDNLNEMVHILCHDLANPLQVISMIVQSARGNPASLANDYNVILDSTTQSLNIIDLVRYLRAIEEGKTDLILSPVDLKLAMDKSMEIIEYRFKDKHVTLSTNIEIGTVVIAEEYSLINTVLNNLISNAIKFSYKDSYIEIESEIKSEIKSDELTLTFKDHGVGIPKDLMQNLFKSSAKTTRSGTSGEAGTGFGLPLVKKIMHMYGGEICIDSREIAENPENHGTNIILTFKIPPKE